MRESLGEGIEEIELEEMVRELSKMENEKVQEFVTFKWSY